MTRHADTPAPYREIVGGLMNPRGVIKALAEGRIDVGPLDSYCHDLIRDGDPGFAGEVRILESTDPTPMPPIVATAALDPATVERLRAAFLAVAGERSLARAHVVARQLRNARSVGPRSPAAAYRRDRRAAWPEAAVRTRIRGGWWWVRRGSGLDRTSRVRGRQILYVGPAFEAGSTARSMRRWLVALASIQILGHRASPADQRAGAATTSDRFSRISVPKRTRIDGDVRYLRPDETGEREFHALFTVAELLRNGVTTFVEYGSQLLIQEALKAQCLKLGLRGYLGPGYDSGRWVGDEQGRLKRVVNEANGWREFAGALEWIARNDGAGGGLVKGILVPRELETCSLELLRATRAKAEELKMPMATHAAYSIVEFYETVREYRRTPIELLDELGMLRPTLNIGHGNLPSDSVRLNYSGRATSR
jgi:hypothetical protein